jgi:hypothetical protein
MLIIFEPAAAVAVEQDANPDLEFADLDRKIIDSTSRAVDNETNNPDDNSTQS